MFLDRRRAALRVLDDRDPGRILPDQSALEEVNYVDVVPGKAIADEDNAVGLPQGALSLVPERRDVRITVVLDAGRRDHDGPKGGFAIVAAVHVASQAGDEVRAGEGLCQFEPPSSAGGHSGRRRARAAGTWGSTSSASNRGACKAARTYPHRDIQSSVCRNRSRVGRLRQPPSSRSRHAGHS